MPQRRERGRLDPKGKMRMMNPEGVLCDSGGAEEVRLVHEDVAFLMFPVTGKHTQKIV
jgi:hypothetical protein